MKAIVALKKSHELPYVLEVEEEELQNEDGHRQDFPALTFLWWVWKRKNCRMKMTVD